MNFSCGSCDNDQELRRLRGCNGESAPKPVKTLYSEEENVKYILWNCPSLFVTPWCRNFVTIYDAYKNHPGNVDILTLPLKYLRAETFFINTVNQFSALMSASRDNGA